MTAEIAILNKEAVALAADSAITAGFQKNQKIFGSANKLFALSKYSPVGLMIYGSAQYMAIPWETIIKQYRRQLDEKKFPNLYDMLMISSNIWTVVINMFHLQYRIVILNKA